MKAFLPGDSQKTDEECTLIDKHKPLDIYNTIAPQKMRYQGQVNQVEKYSQRILVLFIDGAEFYNLSPDAALRFTVSPTANLSDGLQLAELVGTNDVFYFNAREFNQAPGRYHPPILRLNSDGTGSLANADNQSDVPNPPPPQGSGMLVDVEVGEEYSVILATDLPIDISEPILPAARQVPLIAAPLFLLLATLGFRAFRRKSFG